jgi:DNA-binding NarL/FixJ family response regulator
MNILVVDDHPHVRLGTAISLRDLINNVSIIEADSMAGAREAISAQENVELVLLDLSLADSSGIETLKTFRGACEAIGRYPRIVIVSGNEEADLIDSVLNEHGTGFIPKGASGAIFRYAVQLTLAGGVYIPELYLRMRQPRSALLHTENSPEETYGKLTTMERVIASYCVQGLTYKHIARAITEQRGKIISDLTVKSHVKNIAAKLGIVGEGKAAVVAQIGRLGLKFPIDRCA